MAKVLIVDDSSFMRNSLKYIVEGAGHKVAGMAEEGQEALEAYHKFQPDVVTLDILMTGMGGIDTLKALMKEEPEAKVIMVTAIGGEDRQEEARQLGVSGYITKPFKPTEIVEETERVLAHKG